VTADGGRAPHLVCLDLTQVRFFSAAGIRIMFTAGAATAGLDGGLQVVCSAVVMRILEICKFTRIDGLRLSAASEPKGGRAGAGR
jgi:anti-anti-sigma regulatory factor